MYDTYEYFIQGIRNYFHPLDRVDFVFINNKDFKNQKCVITTIAFDTINGTNAAYLSTIFEDSNLMANKLFYYAKEILEHDAKLRFKQNIYFQKYCIMPVEYNKMPLYLKYCDENDKIILDKVGVTFHYDDLLRHYYLALWKMNN